jgi:hypothetical protein
MNGTPKNTPHPVRHNITPEMIRIGAATSPMYIPLNAPFAGTGS